MADDLHSANEANAMRQIEMSVDGCDDDDDDVGDGDGDGENGCY